MALSRTRFERLTEAYLAMAETAKYRPAAPSDGMGNIILSKAELGDHGRLHKEMSDYAEAFDPRALRHFY